MKLTDVAIKQAKAKDKQYKISDGGGMYLLVTPSGKKYWRMKYYIEGKEKLASLGIYPYITLVEARNIRAKLKQDIALGIDVNQRKKESKQIRQGDYNFQKIAEEWHKRQIDKWTVKYSKNIMNRLSRDIFPKLGYRDIREIKALELLKILQEVEERGAVDLAKRLLQICGQIFRYAIITEKAERNITGDLKGALQSVKKSNYSRLKVEELPEFLNKLENYNGEILTKLAIKLVLHTFVRTIELRAAKWEEFKIDKREWHIPASRMKMKEKHIVPLTNQVIKILEGIKQLSFESEYVFPNTQKLKGHMSENTMLYALYRMGYHKRATIHGFRGLASTILNEKVFNSDWIERQLAHSERNSVRSSYNYAQYLSGRKEMMEWWSNYLNEVGK